MALQKEGAVKEEDGENGIARGPKHSKCLIQTEVKGKKKGEKHLLFRRKSFDPIDADTPCITLSFPLQIPYTYTHTHLTTHT